MILPLPQIQKITAYSPPLEERENFQGLRLDFNERTIPLPKNFLINLDFDRCRLYPSYGDLQRKIANYANTEPENIMITNGSDQGMEIIFRTFVSKNDQVVIPSPSFAMFYQVAAIQGAKIIRPQYSKKFPMKAVLEILKKNPKLLILCNPNNPTGTILTLQEVKKILSKAPNTIVYIDEAYFEFSKITAAGLINNFPNLIITRTFSKAFGLAALRIGYIISCSENIQEMLKIRGPYDVNQVAKIAAERALESSSEILKYSTEVMQKAKPLIEKFFTDQKIDFYPSSANFILFKEPSENFSAKLKENGILLRPQANGYSRVTIGTLQQMKTFIRKLKLCQKNMLS